jgi:hypothetical protein
MLGILEKLRRKVAIGFVGGSNLPKQQEQLGSGDVNGKLFCPSISREHLLTEPSR